MEGSRVRTACPFRVKIRTRERHFARPTEMKNPKETYIGIEFTRVRIIWFRDLSRGFNFSKKHAREGFSQRENDDDDDK